IPANVLIDPDIRHALVEPIEVINIRLIPLDILDENSLVSNQYYDPISGETLMNMAYDVLALNDPYQTTQPVRGPFVLTASARNQSIEVAPTGGVVDNMCGANNPGTTMTQSISCLDPGGEIVIDSRAQYCTNNPNNDHILTLPNFSPSFIDA